MRAFLAIAAVTAIALGASATPLQAQRAPIRFGVLAGANLSSVSLLNASLAAGEDLLTNKRRGGVQGAVYATIPLSGRLSLQPELHYVQKGGKAEVTLPFDAEELALQADDRLTLGLRLSYAEIPLLARIDLGSAGAWRPFLVAGPSFALRLSCTASTEVGPLSVSGACDTDEAPADVAPGTGGVDPIRTTDIGAIGGIGLQSTLLGRAFSAQVRYTQGLRSIATDEVPGVSPKNRGVTLVFGLGF